MKTINIGLFGCGTVGKGVVKVLHKNAGLLRERTGLNFKLKTVVDRNFKPEKGFPKCHFSKDANVLFNDPEIDVVVELIGGIDTAKKFVLSALKSGKHVVTANKALLAECGKEIFEQSLASNRDLYFEASVGGGIPIIKALREGLVANHIETLYGIMNGTCNYILTQMQKTGQSYKEVLKEAQEKGFAEANPSFDVDGIDTQHKLVLVASLMSGQWIRMDQIPVEGISHLSYEDIQFADSLGYVIKLLAIAKEKKGELEVSVQPTLLKKEHPLASVSGVFNAIYLKGDPVGHSLFYGRGAGQLPTASAVVSDIVDVARNIVGKTPHRIPPLSFSSKPKKLMSADNIISEYYLRFSVVDTPGVLAKIAGVLGKHKISISSVLQSERKEGEVVPVVVLTHMAVEKNLKQALKEIEPFSFIRKKTVKIRLERESS